MESSNEITINIRLTTRQDQTFQITLPQSSSILDLKSLCVEKCNLQVYEQRMVFKGLK